MVEKEQQEAEAALIMIVSIGSCSKSSSDVDHVSFVHTKVLEMHNSAS